MKSIKYINTLQKKQKMILNQLFKINKHNINKKIHSELSPLGWHVLHCIFVEATWIRSYFYSDETKAISQAVYPGDTAAKLNPWPPEPPWYADARAEYANKFETA